MAATTYARRAAVRSLSNQLPTRPSARRSAAHSLRLCTPLRPGTPKRRLETPLTLTSLQCAGSWSAANERTPSGPLSSSRELAEQPTPGEASDKIA